MSFAAELFQPSGDRNKKLKGQFRQRPALAKRPALFYKKWLRQKRAKPTKRPAPKHSQFVFPVPMHAEIYRTVSTVYPRHIGRTALSRVLIGGLQGIDSLNDRMKERLKTPPPRHDGMKRGKRQAELADGGGRGGHEKEKKAG